MDDPTDTPVDELLRDFGQRVLQARVRLYITRTAMARACNISMHTLRTYEAGRNFPHPAALRKLKASLGCTSDYLLYGETAGMCVTRLRLLNPELDGHHLGNFTLEGTV